MGERFSLAELTARTAARRRAELEREAAFNKTPEGQARLNTLAAEREADRQARVRLGWETEDGEAVQPEDPGEEDADDD